MTIDPAAGQNLAALHTALGSAPLGVQSILAAATSTLSRLVPGTWMALVMDSNPETSRVVVADDAERTMAEYLNTYIATIDRPNRAPTSGLSQHVIESGNPIFRKGVAPEELFSMVSIAGQAFMRTNPPPGGPDVDFLMVPMRVGGATVGTLSVADWRHRDVVSESDVDWVQAAADRIALSIELARLAHAVRDDAVRLDLVRSIGLAFRQRQDVGLVTRVVVEQITSSLNVDAADILLFTEGAQEMVLQATAGFRSAPPAGSRVALASLGMSEDWDPRIEYLADVDRQGRNPRGTLFAREGFQTLASIKLHTRNRLLGLIELYNRSVVEWDQGWLDFYDTLGVLVGVAIDQSGASAPEAARDKTGRAPRPDFSDLELDILRLTVEGLTNGEIAEQVHRSENTIKFHVRRILERTGVSNRTELARHATREGWV